MPFKSEAQRRFMYSQHPEIARRWAKEGKSTVDKKKSNGTAYADNKPVGSAGQPQNSHRMPNGKMMSNKKMTPEKSEAISRRMKKKKDVTTGKSGGGY